MGHPSPKYTAEFKQRAAGLYRERGCTYAELACELGCDAGSISDWVKRADALRARPPQPRGVRGEDPERRRESGLVKRQWNRGRFRPARRATCPLCRRTSPPCCGSRRAPGPGERGPRALSAQFSMTTMLKKRRPFGPLLSEHQHIIRQVNSGPLSGSPLDSCLRPTSQSSMSAQVRYAAGIDSGMVATSW